MKKIFLLIMGVMLMMTATADAKSVRTPEGNFPRVQWAVVESTDGTMPQMIEMGARILAATSAAEKGTYALYGVIEKDNPNLMRLLEIYESDEAYRIHSTSPAFQQYRAERLPILAGLKILPVNGIVLEQKNRGVGTVVQTRRFEISPANLAAFQKIISDEAVRAVREEIGVMGAFVTAEQPRPNFLHTMIIFSDSAAAQKYFSSGAYKNFRGQVDSLIQAEKVIDYQPTKIILSEKF
ncbi:MAG: antibiotic biosynthesis monooxygenase [Selenomonadaceae bacterium]|nr:antibiotic biosynthesis monooxygenase [Selenomonadaceae bacterium]MBQ9497267.1 antibiotic biosynthesis monooxygenase [Selenomonadaceae bacterium]